MREAKFDREVAERMGHPDAIETATIDGRGIRIDIALIPPGEIWKEYSVVTQSDCDPDDQTRGYSGVAGYPSLEEARNAFDAEVAEMSSETAPRP